MVSGRIAIASPTGSITIMAQPIGMLRFTDEKGCVAFVEAIEIQSITRMDGVGYPRSEYTTQIETHGGDFWRASESPEVLAEQYNALILASRSRS